MTTQLKKTLLTLLFSTPIALLSTSANAADHVDDWKSMPATSCESDNSGLMYGRISGGGSLTTSWGWVRASKTTIAQCPMVRDHRSARPARFRVSLYHSTNHTTKCRLHLRNREANLGISSPFNISGNGYVQQTISLNTNYAWGHVHLTCSLSPRDYILSYALHEL